MGCGQTGRGVVTRLLASSHTITLFEIDPDSGTAWKVIMPTTG
jgi:Trk K+ transport system NAD-binding subunit